MPISAPQNRALSQIKKVLNLVEELRALAPKDEKVFKSNSNKVSGHIMQRSEFELLLRRLESEGILEFKEIDNGLTWGGNALYIRVPNWKKFDQYRRGVEAKLDRGVREGSKSTVHPGTLDSLHPEIQAKCAGLYRSGNYPEAVEKGFKIVKDRLRKLTSYEKAHEAFGKGHLYIKGASADNVEDDFQKGVQFLLMAIDMFKNEKGHTSDSKIEDPVRAFEYLSLSSLALNLLENSEVRKKILASNNT